MQSLHRLLFLLLNLTFLVQCVPVTDIFFVPDTDTFPVPGNGLTPRQAGKFFQCIAPGLFRSATLEQQLPAIDIDITPHMRRSQRGWDDIEWTNVQTTRSHRWRWRAGLVGGRPGAQVQLYGFQGTSTELRVSAPSLPQEGQHGRRPTLRIEDSQQGNGGGAEGWGDIICLSLQYYGRPDATYILHVRLGNMQAHLLPPSGPSS